jgi:hypothetical protein
MFHEGASSRHRQWNGKCNHLNAQGKIKYGGAMVQAVIRPLSSRKPGFDPKRESARSVLEKMAAGSGLFRALRLSSVSVILPMTNNHSFSYQRRCIILAIGTAVK